MNTKNNKRSQNSVNKIKTSLMEILKDKKLTEIKISELCKKSNINRTTFYAHYDTVEDVLYEMCEEKIQKVYKLFFNNEYNRTEKLKHGLEIVKNDANLFEYFFNNVTDIEKKIIEMIESDFIHLPYYDETFKLSLAFKISGLVGLGKTYFSDIKSNPNCKISTNDFVKILDQFLSPVKIGK